LDGDERVVWLGWGEGENWASVAEPCLGGTVQFCAPPRSRIILGYPFSSYRRIESTGLPIED